MIETGRCYLISRGSLKVANKKYTTIQHEYEITLNSASQIQPCGDEASIPHAHYAFVSIDEIAKREKDDIVDVLGVATQVGELQTLSRQGGKTLPKRLLTLVDKSSHSIEVAVFGDRAQQEVPVGAVVSIRGCRVGTFNTKSLSTTMGSTLEIAPDLDEAHKLRGWYDAQGGQLTIYPVSQYVGGGGAAGGNAFGAGGAGGEGGGQQSRYMTFGSVQEDKLGMTTDAEYFRSVGVLTLIKHDGKITYQACPTPKCNTKVTQGADGQFFCAKCNRSTPECNERYIMSVTAADYTGSLWLSLFNDQGVQILGMPANDLLARRTPGNEKDYERVFFDASWRWYSFTIRARMEQYREENRRKCTVLRMAPLDFAAESKRLLTLIDSYP